MGSLDMRGVCQLLKFNTTCPSRVSDTGRLEVTDHAQLRASGVRCPINGQDGATRRIVSSLRRLSVHAAGLAVLPENTSVAFGPINTHGGPIVWASE